MKILSAWKTLDWGTGQALSAGRRRRPVQLDEALGASARTRAAIVALFGLWFLSVLALAATETLHTPGLAGVAGLGLAIAAPMLTMIIAVIASDSVRRSLQRIPVSSLIVANTVRVIGVSFLVLHAQGRLTASFALTAGWGDLGIGLTAPVVAWFVATRGAQARAPLTIWNALGVSAAQLGVLVAIALAGEVQPKTLCTILDLEKSTLSRNIALMVGKGWIESKREGRAQLLRLTAAGSAVLGSALPA